MDRKNFAIDLAALVGTVVVLLPSATGIAVHEWLSLVLFAALFAHCALHAISAKALTAMLLVHVVVHGRWLLRFFRKERPAGSPNDSMTGEIDGDR